jgi:pentatricopeptide repeat protein
LFQVEKTHFSCHIFLSRIVYRTLLAALSSLKSFESAQAADMLLNRMEEKYPGMSTTLEYNFVLKSWSACGDPAGGRRAVEVLNSMRRQSVERSTVQPDIVSYNTVLTALNRSREPSNAETILRDLILNPESPRPNSRSFASVISAWSEQGNAKRALTVLDLMPQADCEPNTFIYNAVLQGFVRSKDFSSTENAFAFFRSIPHKFVNEVSFNTMIQLLAYDTESEFAVEQAKELLDEMEQSLNITPDAISYNGVLKTILFNKKISEKEAR